MANAKKCDRCGVCFDPMSGGDVEWTSFSNPMFKSANSIRESKWTRLMYDDTKRDTVDLCPGCTKAFEKFMACDDTFEVKESKEEDPDDGHTFRLEDLPKYQVNHRDVSEPEEEGEEDKSFNIFVSSLDEAKAVKQRVLDIVAEYAVVSVGDVYELAVEENHPEYHNYIYGWRGLFPEDIKIYTKTWKHGFVSRRVWGICFPKPVLLADPPGTTINARQEDLDIVAQTAKMFSAARDKISSVFGYSTDDELNGGDTDGDH